MTWNVHTDNQFPLRMETCHVHSKQAHCFLRMYVYIQSTICTNAFTLNFPGKQAFTFKRDVCVLGHHEF